MQVHLQISYRHCDPSDALNALIRKRTAELERFYPRITGCHVSIEPPGAHHRKGKGAHYRVRIELTVPGKVLVVSRDPQRHRAHEDAFQVTNAAFGEILRQLQDFARLQRRDVKTHTHLPHARVTRLHPEESFGFLETDDGREVYFHRANVLGDAFDRLTIGDEVRFSEEPGEKGAQASTVQRVGHSGPLALAAHP